MGKYKSVFKSKSEEKYYHVLKARLSDKYNIYPQLPFAQIIDLSDMNLNHKKREFLLKTNVDYTICDKDTNEPLLSIEFDGLGSGFSRDGKYYMKQVTKNDPYRKLKMEAKLQIAKECDYPLFVVSYDECDPINQNLSLAILDGIIGQFFAKKNFQKYTGDFNALEKPSFSSPDEKYEYDQDLVTSAEVMSELDYDPLAKLEAKLSVEAEPNRFSLEYLSYPEPPNFDADGPMSASIESWKKRIKAINNAERVGVLVVGEYGNVKIPRKILVRNFEGYGVSPTTIAENIAKILVWQKIIEIKQRGVGS